MAHDNLTASMRKALEEPIPGFKLHIGSSDFVKSYITDAKRQTVDALVRRGFMRWQYRWFNANGDKVYDLVITDSGRKALGGEHA